MTQPTPPAKPPPVCKHFGIEFNREMSVIQAAAWCFLYPNLAVRSGAPAHLRREDWFWYLVGIMWGPKSAKPFVRHPWAEEMAHECCNNKYVGLSGCASSGKSDFLAIWVLINWFVAPLQTKAFITSTSLKDAKNRVWGSIKDYFVACAIDLPGKFIDSMGMIRTDVPGQKVSNRVGIELLAGEQGKAKESIGKLIGFKQMRVLMAADELSELSPSLLEACYTNLIANTDHDQSFDGGKTSDRNYGFQLVAASNFKGFIDPFGQFVEPKSGWSSVNVEVTRWETKNGGICLRFDGLKSPNFDSPTDKWPIYGRKQLAEHDKLGRNSSGFWRMCRSYPAPIGASDVIYTQQDLLAGGAFDKALWSERGLTRLASLDPSFTSGGDRCMMQVGVLGTTPEGILTLQREETIQLKEDVTDKTPFDLQILRQFKQQCEARGITRNQAAFDATGAGITFGTLVQQVWGDGVMAVKFGGAASDLPVRSGELLKQANEVYANRVSELWYQGKEYLRSGQLKGVDSDLADEMTVRKWSFQKGGETRILVESKKDMKANGIKSPDNADSFFILLELARVRFNFAPVGMEGSYFREEAQNEADPVKRYDDVYSEVEVDDSYMAYEGTD